MGWLDERKVDYLYRREDGTEFVIQLNASEEAPAKMGTGSLVHMLPFELGGYTRVQFERNGRIGYEYKQSDGKKRIVSATREKYEHNIGNMGSKALKESGTRKNESVYTKSYGNKVEKAEHRQAEKFVKGLQAVTKEK